MAADVLIPGHYSATFHGVTIRANGAVIGHVTAWEPSDKLTTRAVVELSNEGSREYAPGKISIPLTMHFRRDDDERARQIRGARRWRIAQIVRKMMAL